jgi:hypothetical protein
MGGNTAAENREEQIKKALKDANTILEKSIETRGALSGRPPSKAHALQTYVQGYKSKVEALINIYNAVDRLAALEREKKANSWLKAATVIDLSRYSTDLLKSSLEAALNVEAVRVAVSNPEYAKEVAAASEKVTALLGAPASLLGAISEAIQAIDALQRGDKEAYARSAGRSVSGAIQFALFAVSRGFPGAATAGAAVTFVVGLYVEGIIAFGQLGGILKQIRVEKERRGLQAIVERAYVVAGLARSMFKNYATFFDLVASSEPEAIVVAELFEAEGRRLATHLGSLTRRLEDDAKLSREKFPKALIQRMWSASIAGDGTTLTGQRQLIQEALYATAAYVPLRLSELQLIHSNAIGHQHLHLKTAWML